MSVPDVSVVVPVYNTMPYLTECLDSLVRQTIGRDRMQIVAVDDGSTDRGGAELDRYARRYPGLFTVIHQANSGGPAGPCNTGLDAATGRYVFFVGADDHLGREALARLVAAADEWDSDVVLGKVVGVNSRHIYQDIFARTEKDLDLFDSALPRSLANTKLFRRELLERHRIRYREDMRIGSDLPFTLEACYRAGRISVLADYEFYYAVRRFSGTNITYLSKHVLRVRTVEKVMAFVTGLIPPGKQRDAILLRRFDHEIARLLEDDFLRLDEQTQRVVHDALGRLVAEHLTAEINDQLGAETRIRLALTRDGEVADLITAIRQDAEIGVPPTVVKNGRRYARYPGFGRLPDAVFDVTTAPEWPVKLDATAVSWSGDELTITARAAVARTGPLSVSAGEIPAEVTTDGTTVRIRFRASELLERSDPTGQRRAVSAQPGAFDPARAPGANSATGAGGAAAVRAPGLRPRAVVRRRGARPYVVTPTVDESGRLMISVVPVTAKRVAAQLRKRPG
ncbi:MAG TPA: glycosyltransferase [Actinoplanes sp.]|nr:glycosyltransferase [Actinoplanes sp.]